MKDQLLVDKAVLEDCRLQSTDYKKAYDMVPHTCICECLELFGVAENVNVLYW